MSRFDVEDAKDGQEGLDAMKAKPFELVLCDIEMPIMDGLECVASMRAWETHHRPDERQKVFCVTGADGISAAQMESAGMDGVLRKPYTKKKIRELLGCVTLYDCIYFHGSPVG
jgi:CheY-like chemotaxis protein